MNILNSLTLLEQPQAGDFKPGELVSIAHQNAQRLHRTLAALLDLASLEGGTFHVTLREVDLLRLVSERVRAQESTLKAHRLEFAMEVEPELAEGAAPILADPQKLGRAVELLFESTLAWARAGSMLKLRISLAAVELEFEPEESKRKRWAGSWQEALAGFESGIASPGSIFGGVLQSESAFLTRQEEGLGSEFLLLHEIMRRHEGRFEAQTKGGKTVLRLSFRKLESLEALRAVLASRIGRASTEIGSVALALIQVPRGSTAEQFRRQVRGALFRSTDSVYTLAERGQVAAVLDDCKPEDAPVLMGRIAEKLGMPLQYGTAICPSESMEPDSLIEIADKKLASVSGRRA